MTFLPAAECFGIVRLHNFPSLLSLPTQFLLVISSAWHRANWVFASNVASVVIYCVIYFDNLISVFLRYACELYAYDVLVQVSTPMETLRYIHVAFLIYNSCICHKLKTEEFFKRTC